MKSLTPQSTTEVRWGGVGWRGGGWGYRGAGGRGWGWGWGAGATGAIAGGAYYGGGYPYHDDASYPPYDVEYDEDCAPYGGHYRSDDGW